MQEIWKDIPEWEGIYQASNLGRIKSLARCVSRIRFNKIELQPIEEAILTGSVKFNGYRGVTLSKNGKSKNCLVHRLILSTFNPNILNKECINHIDFNRLNNKVDNLEWVSQKENVRHTHAHNRNGDFRGSKSHFAKLKQGDVLKIRQMFSDKINRNHIAEEFGIHRQTVYNIASKKSWSHI